MWVQWDDNNDRMLGMVRHLPANLQGRGSDQLIQLGYRELVSREPEDYIRRFPTLLGNAKFERMPDGRVLQTWPDADFSVSEVRAELVRMVKKQAMQELAMTDWYFIRAMEYGDAPVPSEVKALRSAIRDHVDWLEADIAKATPRALVDYRWMFPKSVDQQMIDGLPVVIDPTPPPPVAGVEPPPDPNMPETGEAVGVWGNDDPTVLEEPPGPPEPEPVKLAPPATTDGPVLTWNEEDGRPDFLDANGMPLITAYAPNVPEDETGPKPDQK